MTKLGYVQLVGKQYIFMGKIYAESVQDAVLSSPIIKGIAEKRRKQNG